MKQITLTTTGFTGKQWLTRLKKADYQVSKWAEQIILSSDFDKARAKKGTTFNIAFITVKELDKEYATTRELKEYAKSKGYAVPTPEIALLLREALSDKDIEEMGAWYIATLHEPIKDSDGDPRVLRANRSDGGRWVRAGWDEPSDRWDARGAFAFLVPASSEELNTEPLGTLDLELRLQKLERFYERAVELIPSLVDEQ